jgi:hypothetical protein
LSYYQDIAHIPLKAQHPSITENLNQAIASHPILPEVLGAFSFSVKSEDAIPEIIRQYLAKYQSPLLPHADFLVNTARKYKIDPRLLVAIAQQESNLCKKIPDNSHNCWGWGIHSQGTLKFDSYPEAINAVAKGLSERYLGQGLNTPEEIMGIYTPLSDGSWARGVQQFLDEMN